MNNKQFEDVELLHVFMTILNSSKKRHLILFINISYFHIYNIPSAHYKYKIQTKSEVRNYIHIYIYIYICIYLYIIY